jgi:alkylation response protein AidB-like acyl-CoA dehydrogenase
VLDFARTQSQRELRDSVRAFASAEVSPYVSGADRDKTLPVDLGQRFHNTGIPQRFLESSGPYLSEICMVTEELGYACAACASYLMLPIFFNRFLLRCLAEPEAEALRRDLKRGPGITSFADLVHSSHEVRAVDELDAGRLAFLARLRRVVGQRHEDAVSTLLALA